MYKIMYILKRKYQQGFSNNIITIIIIIIKMINNQTQIIQIWSLFNNGNRLFKFIKKDNHKNLLKTSCKWMMISIF